MNALLEELDTALIRFRTELSYTDWQDHPHLLAVIRAKEKLVAMSKGDYKSLWEIEKKAHEETQQRAAEEKRESRAKLLQVSCAYLKKLGASVQQAPSSCSCDRTGLLRHLLVAARMPILTRSEEITDGAGAGAEILSQPVLPSSPPPEAADDDDLYS